MLQYALGHCLSNNLKVVCLLNITLLYTTRSHTFHAHTLYEGDRNMPPYNLRIQSLRMHEYFSVIHFVSLMIFPNLLRVIVIHVDPTFSFCN